MINWQYASEAHVQDIQRSADRERLIREALEARKDEKRQRDADRRAGSRR